MKMFTKSMQADLARQMFNKARDIDVALINTLDESMPNEFILDALMFYLNNDGGFANGLYIDNYNTNSSVYQTYEALRILDMANIDSNCQHELYDHIINKSMNYLYNRAELKDNKWNPNVVSNNEFAHSYEFEYTDENKKLFGYAPTAAILGYTLVLCKPNKAYYKKAIKMIDIMLKDFYTMDELTKREFISFNSFLNSIKKANVLASEYTKIEEKLISLAKKQVSLDFSDFNAIHPSDCCLYLNDKELNEKLDLELDYIIDSVASHGMWEYLGSWGYNKYAEEDSAKIKWLGAVSVNNYFILKKCGRIE